MRARDVVGKKIVRVNQDRFCAREFTKEQAVALDSIELDNGMLLVFNARESVGQPYVTCDVLKLEDRKSAALAREGK